MAHATSMKFRQVTSVNIICIYCFVSNKNFISILNFVFFLILSLSRRGESHAADLQCTSVLEGGISGGAKSLFEFDKIWKNLTTVIKTAWFALGLFYKFYWRVLYEVI